MDQAKHLRSLLPKYYDHYTDFQFKKYGNILPTTKKLFIDNTKTFASWFNNQSELQELSMLGY